MKMVVGKHCGRCKIAESILMEKGYDFHKIMFDTDEGKEIIDKTQAKELPILVDNGKVLKGQEVVEFASNAQRIG